MGYRYRLHRNDLLGKPDLIFVDSEDIVTDFLKLIIDVPRIIHHPEFFFSGKVLYK